MRRAYEERKESGTPTNAVQQPPRLCVRRRPPTFILPRLRGRTQERARSPVGVPPRHLRQRPNATAQLQPRDFRGLGRSARPDGSKDARFATHGRNTPRPTRHRGRYPRLPVPVQRDCTRSPVMMPAGRVLPKPPGSTGDEPMPAGTAPAPPPGGPPDGVLVSERDWGNVTE